MISNSDFFASDIYPKWEEYVGLAKKSIIVISPYLDDLVVELLDRNRLKSNVKVTVITKVDSATIFDKPYQVRALINCVRNNFSVRHLKELHAKLIIVDQKYISVGSQNFTKRGRKNKETSMISTNSFEGSNFINEIEKWVDESIKLELEYLIQLEKRLEDIWVKREKLKKIHDYEFEKFTQEFLLKKKEKLLGRLKKQRLKSNIQLNTGIVKLSLHLRESKKGYSLMAHYLNNLLLHKTENSGTKSTIKFNRLHYYPMFNVDNMAITYVRIAKTRISYYISDFEIGRKKIAGHDCVVFIKCPIPDKHQINYIFQLKFVLKNQLCTVSLSYFFDGEQFKLMDYKYDSLLGKDFIDLNVLKNKKMEYDFISNYFNDLSLESLGNDIIEFFEEEHYNMYAIEFLNNPILICESQK